MERSDHPALDSFDSRTRFAMEAVREASLLAHRIQNETVPEHLEKSDRSPVTVADFAVQALLAFRLGRAYPADPLVAEEESGLLTSKEGRSALERIVSFLSHLVPETSAEAVCRWIQQGTSKPAERYWTLDPIDGTKGFLRRAQYATAFAFVDSGLVQIAVLGCPKLSPLGSSAKNSGGALFVAERGRGSWSAPLETGTTLQRLRVSSTDKASEARMLRSVESGHTDVSGFSRLIESLGSSMKPLLMDSQAKYAALAAGRADLMFRLLSPGRPGYREKIWDQAAGSLLVEEAGGVVSDLRGRRLRFDSGRELVHNRGILASNGRLHEQALTAIARLNLD